MKKLIMALCFIVGCAGTQIVPQTYNERLITAQKAYEKTANVVTESVLYKRITDAQAQKALDVLDRVDNALDLAEAAAGSGDYENGNKYLELASTLLLALEQELQ